MASERATVWSFFRPACPACDGKGGHMDGYYQPEFSGCRCCNPREDNEDEITRVWRWRWWLFRFREWREVRRLDRWIERHRMTEDEMIAGLEQRGLITSATNEAKP